MFREYKPYVIGGLLGSIVLYIGPSTVVGFIAMAVFALVAVAVFSFLGFLFGGGGSSASTQAPTRAQVRRQAAMQREAQRQAVRDRNMMIDAILSKK